MDKKRIIILAAVVGIAVLGVVSYLAFSLHQKNIENEEMLMLAEMDKREMENEYAQFAVQYSEMKTQINNDSLIAQLDREQRRTEELLEELKRVKSNNAKEIRRLKQELATLRTIMRGYIMEIDSLNRLNQALAKENKKVKAQYNEAQTHISSLTTEKETLTEKVAIASQLDATSITVTGKNKRGKTAKKIKDVKKFVIDFVITKNITASTGIRPVYVRILRPANTVVTSGGTFTYENRQLEYTIMKEIEYTGEEHPVTMYWDVAEYLSPGKYRVDIFCDGNNIGTSYFEFEK